MHYSMSNLIHFDKSGAVFSRVRHDVSALLLLALPSEVQLQLPELLQKPRVRTDVSVQTHGDDGVH